MHLFNQKQQKKKPIYIPVSLKPKLILTTQIQATLHLKLTK